jgi:regulator of sigma E protease
MHAFIVSTISFFVLVGIMVVVHELGHFIAAKLCGVRVEAFSFGFGPRLFGFKYGETDYKVCLLPLGGYVKMTGEEPGQNMDLPVGRTDVAPSDAGAFTAHPRWQRMIIGFAGPIANFILAIALMVFYFGWINEVPLSQVKTTSIEWVTPGSAAAQADLETGDTITSFDSVENPDWDAIFARTKLNANQTVSLSVERDGKQIPLTLHVPAAAKSDDFDLSDAGILPQILSGPIPVHQIQADSPAERAGLQSGDLIQAVDGHTFHNVTTLLAYMQTGQGKPITLSVLRNGKVLPLVANPAKLDGHQWMIGFVPGTPPFRNEPLPFGQAVDKSFAFCKDNSTLVVEVIKRIFTHRVSISEIQGPVGIARMAGDAAEINSWFPKFDLGAQISLQLGMLNLLPFPILDGGMILFLIIESALRHDINLMIKERIYQAAFVVLVVFFVFILFSDVTKLPLFAHVKP